MLAFKYFNNNVNLLDDYLDKNNIKILLYLIKKFESISQLNFHFNLIKLLYLESILYIIY